MNLGEIESVQLVVDQNKNIARMLRIAVEIIKNEYPEDQWDDYCVGEMENALKGTGYDARGQD